MKLVNLNVGKVEKILGDVNNDFVHESWSYVQTIHVVVHIESARKIQESIHILTFYGTKHKVF